MANRLRASGNGESALTSWLNRYVGVPAGEHDVTFHYAPPGQRVGAAVSVPTALAMVAVFGWDRRRQRREPTAVPTVVAQAEPEPSPVVP